MSPVTLSLANLDALPAGVERPRYDRTQLRCGIVHLGLGAFHRAHQAVYTEQVLASGDLAWGIVGASLRSPDTRDALAPQDGLYTVSVRGPDAPSYQVIGAIQQSLVATENPQALIAAMAHEDVKIVSLTVTEKGYCHDPATGELNEAHPDIVHDLAHPDAPRSAIGFLMAGLRHRYAKGLKPFTVLTCDNLPANGHTVAKVLRRYAQLSDPALAATIAKEVAFPSTMVDRIVPSTTDADRAALAEAGIADAWPIMTEPFTQWVIEDHFPLGRPDWGRFGAQLVQDVLPFETMKLRMLNGAHSTLAYLGYLSGYETVAEAMGDAALAATVERMMREDIPPTLIIPQGTDVAAYRRSLLDRFRNPALRHRTWQIAMDGSQKLPQRLLGPARDLLVQGRPLDRIALGVAAWMRYVTGVDEQGQPIDVRDPLAQELRQRADAAGRDSEKLARSLLSIEAIFGADLPHDPRFAAPVIKALDSLFANGVKATLQAQTGT